ncbi:GNAT family N-acetyltransferase [Pseudalkalibacillus hwajinpoensis]|uniref:GNAT family N-acetyltransferase n=1 Tax=Guptibacillus hwajinpoensis TaxID=208199 RepID=A0A4U1MEV3_9BACL|nr:GNAT family N-acetyltransferase [Pseudalkalibacillus hwajinpoensis]TKD68760.1 GNAT family N-acetyltransferase [Pseudalkalibacillus hwajinpoensis]
MESILTQSERDAGVKLLDGRPYYLAVENLEKLEPDDELEHFIKRLEELALKEQVQHVTITIDSSFDRNFQQLKKKLYILKSRSLEYINDLSMETLSYNYNCNITFLSADEVGVDVFLHMWEISMSSSMNAPSNYSIEEQYEGMKQEIGVQYKTSCYAVFKEGIPLGVVIPIIEPGTTEEGRLFYYGLLPNQRGKGLGTIVHHIGLKLLKQKGASYYIGSTGIDNEPMQQIFRNNDCVRIREVVTFTKAF